MKETGIRAVAALLAIGVPFAACATDETYDRTVAAEPKGSVVISNVSGSVEVQGWDRNEVRVIGELDEDVKSVDVETGGGRTTIKVVLPSSANHGSADLKVSVPRMSSVEVSAVSADVSSRGVTGTQRLTSVSGEIDAEISGDNSAVKTVSGDLKVRGSGKPVALRASSVSGSLDLANFAGKLDLVTVSGDARAQLGEASEVRGRTTSGDLEIRAQQLSRAARVDVEAVSGEVTLRLGTPVGLSIEIESFSGDIHGCLAKGVEHSKYGPGSRLTIRTVEDGPRVRAKTLSGDIDICDK